MSPIWACWWTCLILAQNYVQNCTNMSQKKKRKEKSAPKIGFVPTKMRNKRDIAIYYGAPIRATYPRHES